MAGIFAPNPNDPRVIRTRRLILDAFGRLMHEKDFNEITILDVARAATINRATFYAHFQDKYALMEAFLQIAFEFYVPERIDAEAGLNEESVRRLILSLCEYHEASSVCIKRYDSVALLMEEDIRVQLERFLLRMLTARAEDEAETEENRSAATMIAWSVYGLAYRWHRGGGSESREGLADRGAAFVISGFAPPRSGAERESSKKEK
ncbi:TetR family transcriptional regulator [Saccharibacillus sp. CPCC 101409]|uniref:TetR/AcrR family transcriptional regulator n=1 Tax=Saccharibacillus sp. CPCC 101409 TaxID=3058041 RepID=UPI00267371E2|nr:TetR family transcriptional regulator [Saccharibacillus sp. CPCC 101409]MDO3408419.1 TetR family transcriptional regulator [Saccharibacillus sp. CPCC 101409]